MMDKLCILLAMTLMLFAGTAQATEPESVLDEEEQDVLTTMNNYRWANGLEPLSLSSELNAAAAWMSNDMMVNDYFDHTDSLGRDTLQRMADFGYGRNNWRAENLAVGVDAAEATVYMWMDSPGHNVHMLNPRYTVVGIARTYGNRATYWVMDFGGPWLAPTPAPTPAPPAPTPSLSPLEPVSLPNTGGDPRWSRRGATR